MRTTSATIDGKPLLTMGVALRAARPWSFPATVAPVLLGTAAAFQVCDVCAWWRVRCWRACECAHASACVVPGPIGEDTQARLYSPALFLASDPPTPAGSPRSSSGPQVDDAFNPWLYAACTSQRHSFLALTSVG